MLKHLLGLTLIWSILLVGGISLLPQVTFAQVRTPPHVFTGSVTSADGNTEFVSGTITAVVDVDGNGTFEEIVSEPIVEGQFVLKVEERYGASFAGKKVKFMVDGIPTDLEVTWEMGGINQLTLKLSPAATPVTAPTDIAPAPTSVPPTMQPREPGFRENPTTRLRPVNDQTTADQDGIIEIFMFNPSVNDVALSVDIIISVPSGIHVYGEGFPCAGNGAGACSGSFTIVPGQSKAGHLNVKAEKTGSHQVHFSGFWWPGGNKDLRQPISLTHPFNVREASRDISPPLPEATYAPAPTYTAYPTHTAGRRL